MSRPKPIILGEVIEPRNSKTYNCEQILAADAIYAVFFDGKPINLRDISDIYAIEPKIKYKKVSFSNPGHAFNLAEKLNKKFKTNAFAVYKLTVGEKIVESDD